MVIASTIPIPDIPKTRAGPLDKPAHLCGYLVFAWLMLHALTAARVPKARRILLAVLIPTAFGAAMEGVQSLLPYRSAEWGDFFANLIGATIGVALALGVTALVRRVRRRDILARPSK